MIEWRVISGRLLVNLGAIVDRYSHLTNKFGKAKLLVVPSSASKYQGCNP